MTADLEQWLPGAGILIVDDEAANVGMLERLLRRAGYERLRSTTDSSEVLALFDAFEPDLVLLDLHMPQVDGFALLDALGERSGHSFLPVLVLTGDVSVESKQRALSTGAKDFLTKPFETTEALLRIRNLLQTRFLQLQLQNQNERLEQKVRERTAELEAAQIEVMERLARAAEFHDDDTAQHNKRVSEFAARLGRELGLAEEKVELIRRAALLHDVGKIAIPDAILLRPRALTREEFEVMKSHTTIGAKVLSGSRFELLRTAEEVALSHHERWDGNGYPRGLKGEEIPLPGLIVSVADVFDALTHDRPYRRPLPVAEAVAEIRRQSGQQFDPRVVEAFLAVVARMNLLEEEDPEVVDSVLEAPVAADASGGD